MSMYANDAMTQREVELLAQVAALQAHLEAQRLATYQAVEREHAAKREVTELREALSALYAVQNGSPLIKYEQDWNEAIRLTEHALKVQP